MADIVYVKQTNRINIMSIITTCNNFNDQFQSGDFITMTKINNQWYSILWWWFWGNKLKTTKIYIVNEVKNGQIYIEPDLSIKRKLSWI